MEQQIQTKQIPKGWKKEKIGEVFEILGGDAAPKKNELSRDGDIDFVRMQDLGRVKESVYISNVKDKVNKGIIKERKLKLFKKGSILIPRSGSVHLNHRAILKEDSCVVSHIGILQQKKDYNNLFLFYLLKTIDMRKIMHQTTGLNLIRFADLKEIEINILESKEEQSSIVQAIETQFTRLDESVKLLKVVKQKLEVYRKAVLKKAFEKKEGWEEKKIREVCNLINGKAFKTSEWARQGLPIIRIQNLNNENAEFNYLNSKVEDKYRVENGQLLFAWSGTPGTSFGAHIWDRGKAVLNQHIFKVDIDERKTDKRFLMHLFNKNIQEYVTKAHGTAGLAHITKRKFEDALVYLPKTVTEQSQIVQSIEDKFSFIDKLEQVINDSLKKADKLRKSILKVAFEGKLVKMEEVRR